jgi:hypothetical protein
MKNSAAVGYMIMAARLFGLTTEQIKKLEEEMLYYMDAKTEEEAENAYKSF